MQPDLERDVRATIHGASGTTARIQAWEAAPQSPDEVLVVVELDGERFEATSPRGYFDALCIIRRRLETQGVFLHCFASSRNVYPSRADLAYRTTLGKQAIEKDLVHILDEDPEGRPVTVEEQEAFHGVWLRSLGIATPGQGDSIRFDWNGKHGEEFVDRNQEFRFAIAELILAEPGKAPVTLVRDILLEDGLWSQEAWCAPNHFSGLLSILLQRGGAAYLDDFAVAMNATFDTFGAAHEVVLPPQEARGMLEATNLRLATVTDEPHRTELVRARDLFQKVMEGNAAKGWVAVPQGTAVDNVRVVETSALRRWLARLVKGWRG